MIFDRHSFWRNPEKSDQSADVIAICKPEYYLNLNGITNLIIKTLEKYLEYEDSILEIGSGTGRNLAGLWKAGYKNLSGIEINKKAIELGIENFPELTNIEITCTPIEDTLKKINPVSCIFTQGILQHLPPETDWIHQEMVNKSNKIIMTIENENPKGIRSWQRNYHDVFIKFGLKEIETIRNTGLKGHSQDTIVRVFEI